MNPFKTLTRRLFSQEINSAIRAQLSTLETDTTFTIGAHAFQASDRDRYPADRANILLQSLEAWRTNPLARRIVGLTSQFVVGGGITVASKKPTIDQAIKEFWHHPLNRMPVRLYEWCDELTRTGNLFILLSHDPTGKTYVRSIPAQDVLEIQHQPNDIEQPTAFVVRTRSGEQTFPSYSLPSNSPFPSYSLPLREGPGIGPGPGILHYTINRPTGAQWGESDLAPVLKWLARYSNWLEDRARLNHYRTAYLYVITARFNSEAERISRQRYLNATPPTPGSILVCDENEKWNVLEPKLDSSDAQSDGLSIKKMIAAGCGIPLHFLAEPESATRTTAEAAGTPTYRHFEQRQNYFVWLIQDMLTQILTPRNKGEENPIIVTGADISARDNLSLSMAAEHTINAVSALRDKGLIDDHEFLRLVYRFSGENADIEETLANGNAAPPPISFADQAKAKAATITSPSLRKGSGVGPVDTHPINTPNPRVNPDTGEISPSQSGE